MDTIPWHQINVAFGDWSAAEHTAVTRLAPLLAAAEADGLTSWFFIRRAPCWQIRYQPAADAPHAHTQIQRHLADLKANRHVDDVTEVIYEPEAHVLGGADGMVAAHRLFHLDSRHVLAHLADTTQRARADHRRELSILLCGSLLRAAGQDWCEQGGVWARVAAHRELPDHIPAASLRPVQAALRRLMRVDATRLARGGSPRVLASGWDSAFAAAGRELADLAAGGLLRRGLRAVLADHIVFAWNRLGLPHATQAVLANTAKAVVFDGDPTP